MDNPEPTPMELEQDLNTISEQGIQADRHHLKKDMCAQFVDPREWIREYAVNAFDARAGRCIISGSETDDTVTIVVEDDGHGMDRQGVLDFNTVYRSVKRGDSRKAVGRHGIGKLSAAAIKGQCGFTMITSTGTECWRMNAGSLLAEEPIRLERVEPVPSQGTRFEITFAKDVPLHEELAKLYDVLHLYLKYLPLEIIVFMPPLHDPKGPDRAHYISGRWGPHAERFGRTFSFDFLGMEYEVILGLGSPEHEIYQNRVLISKKYNLVAYDLKHKFSIPHLRVLVDSPDFEVPFGRSGLSNEDVLEPLAEYLREYILPQYLDELCGLYAGQMLDVHSIHAREIEEIAYALMAHDPDPRRSWCRLPVFFARNMPRLSLNKLREIVSETHVLYLESEDNIGADYSAFEAPVIIRRQPEAGLKLLEDLFAEKLVNLGLKDVVLEAPAGTGPELGPREKKFQQFLGFRPEALDMRRNNSDEKERSSRSGAFVVSSEHVERMAGVCEESRRARDDVRSLNWRVNYLVGRDGKTPCRTHRFLLKNDTVILNLNHPEVKQLLNLSDTAPALAGHWALALCLEDETRVLQHLTPEAREDLLHLDGIIRCGNPDRQNDDHEKTAENPKNSLREFLNNNYDPSGWLN